MMRKRVPAAEMKCHREAGYAAGRESYRPRGMSSAARRAQYHAARNLYLREAAVAGGPCSRLCGYYSRPGKTTCKECGRRKVRQTMEARRRRK